MRRADSGLSRPAAKARSKAAAKLPSIRNSSSLLYAPAGGSPGRGSPAHFSPLVSSTGSELMASNTFERGETTCRGAARGVGGVSHAGGARPPTFPRTNPPNAGALSSHEDWGSFARRPTHGEQNFAAATTIPSAAAGRGAAQEKRPRRSGAV